MAYPEEEVGPRRTNIEQVGDVVAAIMAGYTMTQDQIAKSEHASSQIVAAGVALGEIDDPAICDMYSDPAGSELSDVELATLREQRDSACLKRDAAEEDLRESMDRYKRHIGGMLLGRTVSVHIHDKLRSLQRPGDMHGTPMPSEITGRFAGCEPSSAIIWLATDEDRFPVRLYMPDFAVPNKILHAANITAIDFPD